MFCGPVSSPWVVTDNTAFAVSSSAMFAIAVAPVTVTAAFEGLLIWASTVSVPSNSTSWLTVTV